MRARSVSLFMLTFAIAASAAAQQVDVAAAEALMKRSNCNKCHAADRTKDGPSYRETAAKYKGKPDAEQKLHTHLTTNPMVKVEGQEERHDALKTKNDAEVRNVIAYILSR